MPRQGSTDGCYVVLEPGSQSRNLGFHRSSPWGLDDRFGHHGQLTHRADEFNPLLMTKKRNRQGSQAVAVFADCQNVGSLFEYRQAVLTFVKQFGPVPLLWAYHYWREMKLLRELQLQSDGWQPIDVPIQDKNALDEQLIRDCHRLCRQPFIKVVVLITGDKDFAPLVKSLISQNKQVIVIGRRGHVSRKLSALVPHDTYAIEDLPGALPQKLKAA
jgi:uncharacterized LabA/DUF88 family protein